MAVDLYLLLTSEIQSFEDIDAGNGVETSKICGLKDFLGMFYPDEDYSEIEMYKREFMPMMDDIMKNAKFVPQTVSFS